MYIDKVTEYYDYHFPVLSFFWPGDIRDMHFGIWDNATKTLPEAVHHANEVLAEIAQVKSGEKILDIGCGFGKSATWLANTFSADVTGITISTRELECAKKMHPEAGFSGNLEFFLEDYTRTHFSDNTFDLAWATESIIHALDKEEVLREVYRVLKPGGRLIIADVFREEKQMNQRQEKMIQIFFRGFVIDNVSPAIQFENILKKVHFSGIQNHNITSKILQTSILMARVSRVSLFFSQLTSWIGIAPEFLVASDKAGCMQLPLFKEGVLSYRIFFAEKGTAETTNH